MKKNILGLCVAMLFAAPAISQAAVYTVKAFDNSTSGGTGVAVVGFNVNDAFTVSVNPLDLWNAGPLPRWSNADGLILGSPPVTGGYTDASGDVLPAGTIGPGTFADWTQGSPALEAAYGSLVGSWNGGTSFFKIGTSYSGVAAGSTLNLYYFDSNNGDNTGSILADVNVTAVPEPETYAMMLAGLGLIGFSARRRKN